MKSLPDLSPALKLALSDQNPDSRGDKAVSIINMAYAAGYQAGKEDGTGHDSLGLPKVHRPEPWEPLKSVQRLSKF